MPIAAFAVTLLAAVFLWLDMTRSAFTIYPAIICILVALLLLELPAVAPWLR